MLYLRPQCAVNWSLHASPLPRPRFTQSDYQLASDLMDDPSIDDILIVLEKELSRTN